MRAGLIDAVQVLQHRNRLLQRDLDSWKGRHQELRGALEAKSQQHADAVGELQQCSDRLAEAERAAADAAQRAGAAETERAALAQQVAEAQGQLKLSAGEAEQRLQVGDDGVDGSRESSSGAAARQLAFPLSCVAAH